MWPNPQFPANLVTFTGEILDGKLHFFFSDIKKEWIVEELHEISKFHLIFWCRKSLEMQFSLSFGWIVQNLCVSTKIHHHEIRWQLGFSCSEVIVIVHKRFKFINWRYRSSCYRIREICDFKIWSRKIRKVFS